MKSGLARKLQLVAVVWVAFAFTPSLLFSHELWDVVVKRYVSKGEIAGISVDVFDYERLRRTRDPEFREYLSALASATIDAENSTEELLAFWINTYNALTVKLIIEHPCRVQFGRYCWPIASIRDIGGFFKQNWFVNAGKVAGKEWNLQDVEDHLRDMEDYRIHAAIVCASVSCPNLQPFAFVPEQIDEQLNQSIGDFLATPGKGLELDFQTNTLTISSIFNWFAADFKKTHGSVMNFIIDYVTDPATKTFLQINRNTTVIHYYKYDWKLNDLASSNIQHSYY